MHLFYFLFKMTVQYRMLRILEVVTYRGRWQRFLHLKCSLGRYLAGARLAAKGHVMLENQVVTQENFLRRLRIPLSSVHFIFNQCLSMKCFYCLAFNCQIRLLLEGIMVVFY